MKAEGILDTLIRYNIFKIKLIFQLNQEIEYIKRRHKKRKEVRDVGKGEEQTNKTLRAVCRIPQEETKI